MRHSYGTVDRRNILLYKPQLFRRTDDLLIFPSRDLEKWHSELIELIDGLFQINALKDTITIEDISLVFGILTEIDIELTNLFNSKKEMDFSYQYISQMDPEYKKIDPQLYGRDMYHVDRKVLKITPQLKYQHQKEILKYAHWLWAQKDQPTILKVKKR